LFLHPTVILLACAGIASLMPASSSPVSSEAGGENGVRDVNGPSERRTAGLPLLSIAVAAALLAYPLYLEAANAARPPGRDELRPLLHQIAADPATADLAAPPVLYTLAGARAATGYYLAHDPACAPLRRLILLHGPAEVWRQDQRDLDEAAVLRTQAPGTRRAWVLLSTTWHAQYAAQVERARQRFAAAGAKSVIELQAQGALAILYEFPASP
jgi:hypothetical protein